MHRTQFLLLIGLYSLNALPQLGFSQAETQQSLSPAKQTALRAAVLAEMKDQQLVGVSVGVISNGKVVYTNGFGLADREQKKTFSTKTITNWASNSKPVVAVRTLQLSEKGKLKLDDPVTKFLPELPKHCEPITIRHLLCHQSGYPHYTNGRILKLAKPIKSDRGVYDPVYSLNRFGGSPLLRAPGQAYSYSSYAYVILSAVIQRAGNELLPTQLKRSITAPLELSSFGLDVKFDDQKDWSVGYKRNIFGKVERVSEYANDWKHGAGAYKSNIEDFAKWAAALINRKLVSKKSYRLMWTPQRLSSGKPTRVGLGFFIDGKGDNLKVSHGGSHSEARSSMILYPNQGMGVVVLCNCGHANPAKISAAIQKVIK